MNEGVCDAHQTKEIEAECKETAETESPLVPSGEIIEASNGFDADKSVECTVSNETTEKDESFIPETQCDTTIDFEMKGNNLYSEETELNVSQIDNENLDAIEFENPITMPQSHEMVNNSSAPQIEDEIIAESIDVNTEKIQEDVVRFGNEEMSANAATDDSPVFADENIVNNDLIVDPKSEEESNPQISTGIEFEQPISDTELVVITETQDDTLAVCEMINNSQTDEILIENNGKGESETKTNESLKSKESDVSTNVALVSEVWNEPENNVEEKSFTVDSEIASSANEDMHCEQLDQETQDKLQDSFFDTRTESSAVSSMLNDSAQMTGGMMDIIFYDICSQHIVRDCSLIFTELICICLIFN